MGLVGMVGAESYVKSALSQWPLTKTRTQDLSVLPKPLSCPAILKNGLFGRKKKGSLIRRVQSHYRHLVIC